MASHLSDPPMPGPPMPAPPMPGSASSGPPAAEAVARRVLATEARGLARLSEALPRDLGPAVEAILASRGRVIVSGMGKSGHVGRKIAATLASTGTPAFFVHPAEASHGDLGMVTPQDLCLLLSNSGETSELGDLLAYCARFDVPVIAICGRADSTLMRAARYRLLLPDAPEASGLHMAPTTSTTMALALGDALAMAAMERRGFLPEQFRTFHPGGKLGARLATVGQLMHGAEDLPLVGADMPMAEVLIEMTARGFGVAVVTDADGRLAGVISDGDLRRAMDGLMGRRAAEVATPRPVTVTAGTLAARAVALMQERRITALLVVEEEAGAPAPRPVGILRIHDCLRAGVV